ncbi:MAG: hypothetical protein WC052_00820 [Patescibacteria group bacterium]|jgi:hypothetical protein
MAAQVLQLTLPLKAATTTTTATEKAKRERHRFEVKVTEPCRHAGKAITFQTTAVSAVNAERNARVRYNRLMGRHEHLFVEMEPARQLD